jgi:hypothetical protein
LDLLANPAAPKNNLPQPVKDKIVELLKQLMIDTLNQIKQEKK